jgi:DNA-binding transcriptional ArsR family regulator
MVKEFQPIPQMIITDLETLKVMSDELRLKLIEALGRGPATVKQLAELVGVPQSKLYYHVGLLERHGLITVVDTQIVSGIVEKWYQCTAEDYSVAGKLFRLEPERESIYGLIMTIFDSTLAEIRQAVTAKLINLDDKAPDKEQLSLSKSSAFLTPEQAELIRKQLQEIHVQLTEFDQEKNTEGKQMFSLLTGFYPRQATQDTPHAFGEIEFCPLMRISTKPYSPRLWGD